MKLLEWILRVILFVVMVILWNFTMFLTIIWLSHWFNQYYFLQDISAFLNSPPNHIYINFSIFTWILVIYGFIFSIIMSVFYIRDFINITPYPFSIDNQENKISIISLVSLAVIIGLSFIFKKFSFNDLISKSFINASDLTVTILAVLPLSLVFNWILEKPFLVVHILNPDVYKKFLSNYLSINVNHTLSFWAQNVGKRKNKFKFMGICRLKDFGKIKSKKVGAYKLLQNPIVDSSWRELNSQDTMPTIIINEQWLRGFLGLFNETICIVYKSVGERLYRENLNIDMDNNVTLLYPAAKAFDYVSLIFVGIQGLFIYFVARVNESFFLYTLVFVLFLYIIMQLGVETLIKTKVPKVMLACEYDSSKDIINLQISNELREKWKGDLEIYTNDKLVLRRKDIVIEKNMLSKILSFQSKEFGLDNSDIIKWSILLKNKKDDKEYTFLLNRKRLSKDL